jgi:hypothetical protein
MLSTKHLVVTTVATVAVFALVAPQAHAAAEHSPVLTSSTNTNGNNLQYHENYDNAQTVPHQAVVSILAMVTGFGGLHFPDPFDRDLYGSFIYAFHYTGPECLTGNQRQCWHVDAGLAQYGSSVSWAPEPPGEPCEWVVWYAWDWTSHSPVWGGNTC